MKKPLFPLDPYDALNAGKINDVIGKLPFREIENSVSLF